MSLIPKFDVDTMTLDEIKEVVKTLIRLANIDHELIQNLQQRILMLELKQHKQGE